MKILIIDNFDSFTYNVVQLVVSCAQKISPNSFEWQTYRNDSISIEQIRQLHPTHIVISPGPGNHDAGGISKEILTHIPDLVPILGVCLGMQLMAANQGAKIIKAPFPIHGHKDLITTHQKSIFHNLPKNFYAARYHSLIVDNDSLPATIEPLAFNSDGILMAMRHVSFPWVGVQFHPESFLSEYGEQLITNFLTNDF